MEQEDSAERMQRLFDAAVQHAASMQCEQGADFLLQFFRKEQKRLPPALLTTLRVRIAALLDQLEQERKADEFVLLEDADEGDDFVEVAACAEQSCEASPLELWREQQKRHKREAGPAEDFVVMGSEEEEQEEDDWTLLEQPVLAEQGSTRCRRELFLFCRGHFGARFQERHTRFRAACLEQSRNKAAAAAASPPPGSSPSLLRSASALLGMRCEKRFCSVCHSIAELHRLEECFFCGGMTCSSDLRRVASNGASAVGEAEGGHNACVRCHSLLRKELVRRARLQASVPMAAELYIGELRNLMAEIASSIVSGASEERIKPLMGRLAGRVALLKPLVANDPLAKAVAQMLSDFYAANRKQP